MGLRHRSGLGMSLETDALVIIVSEERGKISVAHKGKLSVNVTAEELQQIPPGAEGRITVKRSETGISICNSLPIL